jgi:hypothetical protein
MKRRKAAPDAVDLEFALRRALTEAMRGFLENPGDASSLGRVERIIEASRLLPFFVNTWAPQNIYWKMAKTTYRDFAARGDGDSKKWVERFRALGEKLNFDVEGMLTSH